MLDTAIRLMQAGAVPSVSDVAEAAEVSRATAYRYFPSQAVLVQAVVEEALGPILDWSSDSADAHERVDDLLATSMPRIDEFEATFRSALKHALEEWAARQAGGSEQEPRFTRGHRMTLLCDALAPLGSAVPERSVERLAMALSLLFGIEALVILKDIWGLDGREAAAVVRWAAGILVDGAIAGAAETTVEV